MNPVDWLVCWLSELSLVFAMNRSNWKSAIRHASRALLLKPNDADLLGMRGVALLSLGKAELAIADFSKALELRPTPDTYINRAIAYRDEGEFDLSIADCDEALRLRPQDISVHYEKAVTYRESGEYADAIASFKTVMAVDDQLVFYCQLAETYAEADEWDTALSTWQRGLDIYGDDPELHFTRGKAYAHRGEMQSAKADFETALQQVNPPGTPPGRHASKVLAYLAITHEALEQHDAADELWRSVVSAKPEYNDPAWAESENVSHYMQSLVEKLIARTSSTTTLNS
ncbi:MAG: tetratricopeptide repeat protein [Anaerolineae bacterium]